MSIFNSIEILVVDDESNIRKLFSRELAAPGRNIHTAGSASEAFELLRKNYYDIIILDIRLPDANGLELMSKLLETVPNVAIILITGYADVDNAVEAMKNGAYDYITKPFSLERMEQVIEKAYQRVRLQRENELLRHNTDHKPAPKVHRTFKNRTTGPLFELPWEHSVWPGDEGRFGGVEALPVVSRDEASV